MSKYPRTYHKFGSPGATSDDRIASSCEYLLNRKIVISEKLDGSNCCIVKHGVYARSHAEFSRNAWDKPMWDLHNIIKNDIGDWEIFGENVYGIHSIEYQKLMSYLYIFGIRQNDVWLSWDETKDISKLLQIPTVPILFEGEVKSEKDLDALIHYFMSQPSELGSEKEGLVIRVFDKFHTDDFSQYVQKYVRKDHVKNEIHWTKHWAKAKLNWK